MAARRKPAKLTIELSPEVLRDLEGLLAHGLFGRSLEEVVEEMVRAGVRARILEGWVKPPRGMVVRDGRLMLRRSGKLR